MSKATKNTAKNNAARKAEIFRAVIAKPSKAAKASKAVAKAATVKRTVAVAAKPTQTKPQDAYREGSSYSACVRGLLALGANKFHGFAAVVSAVKKEMGSSYKAFASKEKRNEETAKDGTGKILTNVCVVGRADYGAKLRECGYEVRYNGRDKQAGIFKM